MAISPENLQRGTRLEIGESYLEYSFEKDKQTGETILYLENIYSPQPGSGKELIQLLINQVGRGVQVTADVIESETRKRLIKEDLFTQLLTEPPGASLSVDQKLWPKLKIVRIFQGGGLKVQEVVLNRLDDNFGMLDGWDIGVWIKAET